MRKSASSQPRTIVRTSVNLDHGSWVRLCALAAMRSVDRGQLAAELLRRALRAVSVVDRTEAVEPAEPAT